MLTFTTGKNIKEFAAFRKSIVKEKFEVTNIFNDNRIPTLDPVCSIQPPCFYIPRYNLVQQTWDGKKISRFRTPNKQQTRK